MRTPNCECVVCHKPMYRRPGQMASVRHVACMDHRSEAQRLSGITEAQLAGLSLGRVKGTNHRTGYKHKPESRKRCSETNSKFYADNPDIAIARGEKMRGSKHYRWNGGSSKLSQSIRRMTEHRKWMNAVKERDGFACVLCGSHDDVESHHVIPMAEILSSNSINSRDDARTCSALWDISNGQTLCRRCHYSVHGRKYAD